MFPTYVLKKDTGYTIYEGTTYQAISGIVYVLCTYPSILEDDSVLMKIPLGLDTITTLLRCRHSWINSRLRSCFKDVNVDYTGE